MIRRKNLLFGTMSSIAMSVVILDGKCAVDSIYGGIDLCLRTVIPALLPFFVFSKILNSCFLGQNLPFMRPLQRLCKVPQGAESILLIGLISGYPVGAQLITDAYAEGSLSKDDARRMLGFCSNAGPAFIFGMLSTALINPIVPWLLWGIHIVSALLVGWILPGKSKNPCVLSKPNDISITKSLHNAIQNLVTVCAWVILFRLLLDFLKKWFLWLLPVKMQIMIAGMIELTNGCVMLQQINHEGAKFILASAMLSFGGLCVAMQTLSVTKPLGIGLYFPGKLLQTLLSITLCCLLQLFLFPNEFSVPTQRVLMIATALSSILLISVVCRKKVVAIRGTMLYNNTKQSVERS